jgi:hypothetical protein
MKVITDVSISAYNSLDDNYITVCITGQSRDIKLVRPIAPLTTNPFQSYTSDDVNPHLSDHSPTTLSIRDMVINGYEIEISEPRSFYKEHVVLLEKSNNKKILPKLNETQDTV